MKNLFPSLILGAVILLAAFLLSLTGCAHATRVIEVAAPSTCGIERQSESLKEILSSNASAVSVLSTHADTPVVRDAVTTLETNLMQESNTIGALDSNVASLNTQITNLATDDTLTHQVLSNTIVADQKKEARAAKDSRGITFVVFLLSTITTGVFLKAFWKPMTGEGGWAGILVAVTVTSVIFAIGCAFWWFAISWISQFFPALF